MEYPKHVTKLSKPIKQLKINYKPNKIKVYAESKPADRTLWLDLIKRHILPKIAHNAMELKS